MDILTGSLIVGTGYAIYEIRNLILKKLDFTATKWRKLLDYTGLKDYRLKCKEKTPKGYKLYIELPVGGTVTALKNIKENIEKAYGCKCSIEDIEYSRYVIIEIATNEI